MIKGKTPQDIRRMFNIPRDLSAEEEVRYTPDNLYITILPEHPPYYRSKSEQRT